MKTVNIKGKEYVEVNERLKYFRQEYPWYSLRSEWLQLGETCVCKAVILTDDNRIVAEGTASETEGSSYINNTSHYENCETSAWGRALANFGIGIDASVASAQEVVQAQQQQQQPQKQQNPITLPDELIELTERAGVPVPDTTKVFKAKGLEYTREKLNERINNGS